ncbi:MAG: phosphoribosylanthranilate isomerase [Aestuariivirga sp.]
MTRVKICGLSTPETMDAALNAGADMVGLVFFERSPRHVSYEKAASLANQARGKARIVALVVDADDERLKSIAELVKPDFFQAHGSETPQRVVEIIRLTNIPVIRAIKVKDASDIESAKAFTEVAAMILYDAKAPETLVGALPGGNGLSFDWALLQGSKQSAFMLSGGLTPDNVAKAIAVTQAPIVDVSSGVEVAPGQKDPDLIRKFIEVAKAAR